MSFLCLCTQINAKLIQNTINWHIQCKWNVEWNEMVLIYYFAYQKWKSCDPIILLLLSTDLSINWNVWCFIFYANIFSLANSFRLIICLRILCFGIFLIEAAKYMQFDLKTFSWTKQKPTNSIELIDAHALRIKIKFELGFDFRKRKLNWTNTWFCLLCNSCCMSYLAVIRNFSLLIAIECHCRCVSSDYSFSQKPKKMCTRRAIEHVFLFQTIESVYEAHKWQWLWA